jgi:hypothetical protein
MNSSPDTKIGQITRQYTSHIPIPYGCLTVVAVVLGVLATVVASSMAIAIAILK